MEEGKVKGKSVLEPEEIDFVAGLIPEGKEGASDRILLTEQRGLSMQQRLREIWDAWQNRMWKTALDAILKIPERAELSLLNMPDCYGDTRLESIARVSAVMLFKNASKHLSVSEVRLVEEVLKRIDENEQGLGNEPWKTLFLENAKKSLPSNAREMVETVGKAGIDGQEYIKKVLTPMISGLTHNAEEEDLVRAIYNHENLLFDIGDFYGIDNLDWAEEQRLLKTGDTLLERYPDEIPNSIYLSRAIGVYTWLRNNDIIEIGEGRQEITEIFQECELDRISQKKRDKEIRRIAKRLKII